ncbi:MAG: DUF2171 domain-containing protein [Proteobacteria bacterium]|nr:MAG: DUF2171 domain-containing protein [Pseudomonadota bacterium]
MDLVEINSHIKANLKVLAKGVKVGTVDSVDGDFLKLNRKDADDKSHHWIPLNWIDKIDDKSVYLNHSADEYKHLRRNSKPLI